MVLSSPVFIIQLYAAQFMDMLLSVSTMNAFFTHFSCFYTILFSCFYAKHYYQVLHGFAVTCCYTILPFVLQEFPVSTPDLLLPASTHFYLALHMDLLLPASTLFNLYYSWICGLPLPTCTLHQSGFAVSRLYSNLFCWSLLFPVSTPKIYVPYTLCGFIDTMDMPLFPVSTS
jgi:hypothetical protein